jgi:hypothetical protein
MADNRVVDQHDSRSSKEHFTNLIQFRQAGYALLGKARDALFELGDAVYEKASLHSFVELSLAPCFRRKWSSVYEALQDSRPNREGLMRQYLRQAEGLAGRMLLVGDHTAWPRVWAPTLQERSYQHAPSPIAARRPVTLGHGFSTLVIVPEEAGSWALPLLHERISDQKPIGTAAQQLEKVCQVLKTRPMSLWDAEYGCGAFLKATQSIAADKLIRLRANLCLEGPTKPYAGRGAYPKHGIPFRFSDPTTWWLPDAVWEGEDPAFGPLRVRIWRGLRFAKALDCPLTVAQVERLAAPATRRKPRILWLGWTGEEPPPQWWQLYARRYPVDHWYRFAKGRLHWTLPMLASPEQEQRWSDLMPFLTWQLWLARPIVSDCPLPWQKPLPRLSPGRVCQAMPAILARIGTPAEVCKPRGKSPGWQTGRPRAHRPVYDLIRSPDLARREKARKAKIAANPPKRGRPKRSVAVVPA